jgi:transposase-like protein
VHGALVLQLDKRGAQGQSKINEGHAQSDLRQEDRQTAGDKDHTVAEKLAAVRLPQAATIVRESVEETLSYISFPREFWIRIRTHNVLERMMRDMRRRTRVVGNFPDGKSSVMLGGRPATAHRRQARSGNRIYLDMDRLREVRETAAKVTVA